MRETAPWRLERRRALVTGGTRGIGHAIASELLGLGAHVHVTARTRDDVDRVVSEWQSAGLSADGLSADLTTACDRASPDAGERLDRHRYEAMQSAKPLKRGISTLKEERSILLE